MVAQPAIVISAYNRPRSLERLLSSVSNADYPDSAEVTLVISIDGDGGDEVLKIARDFQWENGTKEIIEHPSNLGLKNHLLSCGDLTSKFGSIIVLEDDLAVSPFFYDYAQKAESAYGDNDEVAGISLYSYRFSENGKEPFLPIEDGNEVYLMQIASSWGQVLTDRKWKEFRNWMANGSICEKPTPSYLDDWSSQSWKKEFIRYLIETDKWFVYPRVSLTTNFEDTGVHTFGTGMFHVPLLQGEKEWRFPGFEKILVRYNAWFRPTEATVSQFGSDVKLAPDHKNGSGTSFSISVQASTSIPDLQATLSSIKEQKWANTTVKILVQESFKNEATSLCQRLLESVHFKIISDPEPHSSIETHVKADVVLRLNSGDRLCSNALSSVAQVFAEMPNVAVVCGLPKGDETVDHRWDLEKYQSDFESGRATPDMIGVFAKRHVMEPMDSNPTFFQVLSGYPVFLIVQDLVERNKKPVSPAEALIRPSIPNARKRAFWRRFIAKVVRRFSSRSETYTLVSELPDLIRFDEKHGTYYFSRA